MAGAHAPRERSSEWLKGWVQVFTNWYPVIRDRTLGGGGESQLSDARALVTGALCF